MKTAFILCIKTWYIMLTPTVDLNAMRLCLVQHSKVQESPVNPSNIFICLVYKYKALRASIKEDSDQSSLFHPQVQFALLHSLLVFFLCNIFFSIGNVYPSTKCLTPFWKKPIGKFLCNMKHDTRSYIKNVFLSKAI